ncbi:MAG: ATP-binding protein [Chloroflexota bacterium]|nr:ATP-binding protein [Chloroflexota bacterium]
MTRRRILSLEAQRSPAVRYGLAVLFPALALLLVWPFAHRLAPTISPPFFAAVALSAWLGGLGPGLLTTFLSGVGIQIVGERVSDETTATGIAVVHLISFALASLLINALDERGHRAQQKARRDALHQRVLAQASQAFSAAVPDGRIVLETVTRATARAVGDACVICLVSEDGKRIDPVAWHHIDPHANALLAEVYRGVRHGLDEGLVSEVVRTGQPVYRPVVDPGEVRTATKVEYAPYLDRYPIHSVLIVPLRARNRVLGALALSRNSLGHPYAPSDISLAQDLADRAALAIDNARLYREAQASEARYRSLFEGTADAVLVVGLDGCCLDANEAATEMLGYTREEFGQIRLDDVSHLGGERADEEHQLTLQEKSWQGELEFRRKDGTVTPVEGRARAVELPSGTVYVTTWRDISGRKALERLREEFIQTVSHDLKTPLTAARTALGLLEQTGTSASDRGQRQLLANARRNVERLGMHIEDLLAHNQLRAGVMHLDPEPIDLREVVVDAVAAVDPLFRQKGQSLEIGLPAPLPVEGDRRRLEQVVTNLLWNAHRHTPAGTHVVVSGAAESVEVHLIVADDGPGIPPNELEAVFERFHRLQAGGPNGSGLGLAIARGLVELHGGQVWAESRPDSGSAFHVALPLARKGEDL